MVRLGRTTSVRRRTNTCSEAFSRGSSFESPSRNLTVEYIPLNERSSGIREPYIQSKARTPITCTPPASQVQYRSTATKRSVQESRLEKLVYVSLTRPTK